MYGGRMGETETLTMREDVGKNDTVTLEAVTPIS